MNGNDLFLSIIECIKDKAEEDNNINGYHKSYKKTGLYFDDIYYDGDVFHCEVLVEKVEIGLNSIKLILSFIFLETSQRIEGVNFVSIPKLLKILKGSKKKIEIILDEDSCFYINKISKLEVRECVCITLVSSDLILK